jgi:hypothetical protein
MSLTVDPIRKFEQRGEACKLTGVYLQTTVANNILVVTGVTGKIIRIMGIQADSTAGTISGLTFKSASGGTNILHVVVPANSSATPNMLLPITDSGYTECNTGDGLYVDCVTTAANVTLFYIVYTPVTT